MLISLDQLKESESRFNKFNQPSVAEEELQPSENLTTATANLVNRADMLLTVGKEPLEFAFERAIGANNSVYSNFCELISSAKQKVGRIVVKTGNKNLAFATGFMVSEKLLLTNWHVFKTKEEVRDSEIEFFYEYDIFGRPGKPIIFKLAPGQFFHSEQTLDYCLVAVNDIDIYNTTRLSSIGYHYLDPTLGKLGDEGVELLNIIHHPDGDLKQLSIRQNRFIKILETTLWYETDTAPGSSGSPVFNDQWQVVALHHMGVPAKTPDGKNYIDKNKNIIEPVDGKIDASRIDWIANEGIRISVLLKDVFTKFPQDEFINQLKKKPLDAASPPVFNEFSDDRKNEQPKTDFMDNNSSTDVQISFPASLMDASGNITININNKAGTKLVSTLPGAVLSGGPDEDLTEGKKMDRENAMDFSQCKGYESNFLGISIPLPKPMASVKKFVAKLKGSTRYVLDYYHYSTIFHSVRMMPMISGINVDGDPNKRKDDSKRVDDWLRDNRLDFDIQLNDKYYSGSNFDKGHMSRREDANWGATAADAKLFADVTCMYTNACPQVHDLNGPGGLWGKLEKLVLEKGASNESGKTAKISVFNGPIFKEDDSVFRGIQIPMEFFKIILWFNDAGKLKATAFKLSQSGLVGDINFDEALDIDANVQFQEFQCSIKSLQKLTKLDFSKLEQFDTFDNTSPNESLKINSEEELMTFIKSTSAQ
ncbi:MAG: DNA/RNA non-specific endonuclease [Bacteroidota bacterium]